MTSTNSYFNQFPGDTAVLLDSNGSLAFQDDGFPTNWTFADAITPYKDGDLIEIQNTTSTITIQVSAVGAGLTVVPPSQSLPHHPDFDR